MTRIAPALGKLTRNTHLWLPGYVKSRLSTPKLTGPARVWLLFADHFEPEVLNAGHEQAMARVQLWRERWPEIAARHTDSAGRPPQYTFFFPEEQYHPDYLDPLAEMAEMGIADVEVHLHHDGEGERDFVTRISGFIDRLHRSHGLLRTDTDNGRIAFGFIHGNWSLDNSLPGGRYCGLNNEISLLRDLGCYADFTLPSAPSPAQTKVVNTIYWVDDDPQSPRSQDRGRPVQPVDRPGDLLLIPGPLGLNFRGGRLLPRIENGEVSATYRVTGTRVASWLNLAPRIGQDIFLKLHAHGARDDNARALLGCDLNYALTLINQECAARGWAMYFASAWQVRKAIEALRMKAGPVEFALSGAAKAARE